MLLLHSFTPKEHLNFIENKIVNHIASYNFLKNSSHIHSLPKRHLKLFLELSWSCPLFCEWFLSIRMSIHLYVLGRLKLIVCFASGFFTNPMRECENKTHCMKKWPSFYGKLLCELLLELELEKPSGLVGVGI